AAFLKDGEVFFSDVRDVFDQQFERLSTLEQDIMYWLAIEREAITLNDIQENNIRSVTKRELQEALRDLRRRYLIETSAGGFTLQNVIMEYLTDRLVNQVYEEITTEGLALFASHALIKAQTKDYVKESQVLLILKPLIEKLLTTLGKSESEKKFKSILSTLRKSHPQDPSYAAGNVLNL